MRKTRLHFSIWLQNEFLWKIHLNSSKRLYNLYLKCITTSDALTLILEERKQFPEYNFDSGLHTLCCAYGMASAVRWLYTTALVCNACLLVKSTGIEKVMQRMFTLKKKTYALKSEKRENFIRIVWMIKVFRLNSHKKGLTPTEERLLFIHWCESCVGKTWNSFF